MTTRLICASHSPLLYCYKKEPADWAALQRVFAEESEAITHFDPDIVIAFGSDHFNGFFLKMMPSFCVGLQAEAIDDIGGFPGDLDVPGEIAATLVAALRESNIDTAVSYKMIVDHAFSQTLHIMLGGVSARPVIPIFINCITTPFVSFSRSRLLGEAVGRLSGTLGKRVLFLASGGMSHHPTRYYPVFGEGERAVTAWQLSGGEDADSLSKEQWLKRLHDMHHEGAEMIARGERTAQQMHLNADVDRRFLEILTGNRLEAYDAWDQNRLVAEAGIGAMELHTWICAAAAHRAAGGEKPVVRFYAVTPEIGIAMGVVAGDG